MSFSGHTGDVMEVVRSLTSSRISATGRLNSNDSLRLTKGVLKLSSGLLKFCGYGNGIGEALFS
jgi:hypothetical protein